jgi:GDSL/SGNH-like Acyl-Esterase family found in Pmr5 and Cas1p
VTASIQEHFPTVLILNRGSHYVPDEELQRDIRRLIREVQAWLQQCDDLKIECYFFWRTTVPGHIGCNTTEYAISTPVYELHDIETQMIQNQSRYNEVSLEYHWHDFQRQNELVTHLFRRAKLSNFQIIDAYYLNVLRPDEHRYKTGDCLHNCYPGKMDVYNRLLLHYMQMQRSTNDIQRLQSVAQKQNWPINIHTVYNATATKLAREIRIQNELEELQQQQQQQQQDKSRSSKRTKSDSAD